MRRCSAHDEEPYAVDHKHLPAHQMNDVGTDEVNFAAVPLINRIGCQEIVVLVIPVQEERSPGLRSQPVQPVFLLGGLVPDAAEITADDHIVVLCRVKHFL